MRISSDRLKNVYESFRAGQPEEEHAGKFYIINPRNISLIVEYEMEESFGLAINFLDGRSFYFDFVNRMAMRNTLDEIESAFDA